MSETIRVIDLSEYTGPVLLANARCMVNRWNVQGVILQAWGGGNVPGRRNEHFHQAVDVFREVGITRIDPYIWPPSDWAAALDWIGDYKRFMSGAVYLDVEAGAGVTDEIVSGVRRAGWEPRIYASPFSWNQIMSNTTKYSDLKLWVARYLLRFKRPDDFYRPGFDVEFPQDALGGFNMGGWRTRDLVGWQTTGTVPDFCGESVDSSIFFRSAFKEEVAPIPTPPDEEEDAVIEARMVAAGVFLEIETKLTMGLAIPFFVKAQAIWLLGGETPNIPSDRELLIVLYRYAAARALRGVPVDDVTTKRMRAALD